MRAVTRYLDPYSEEDNNSAVVDVGVWHVLGATAGAGNYPWNEEAFHRIEFGVENTGQGALVGKGWSEEANNGG